MHTPVHIFDCRPSRWYLAALVAFIIATIGVVFSLSAPWLMKLVLLLLILGYGWYLVKQACLFLPDSILSLRYREDVWHLKLNNQEIIGDLRGDSVMTSWLMLLRFQSGNRVFSSLIFKDTLEPASFRQLFVLLRLRFTG